MDPSEEQPAPKRALAAPTPGAPTFEEEDKGNEGEEGEGEEIEGGEGQEEEESREEGQGAPSALARKGKGTRRYRPTSLPSSAERYAAWTSSMRRT